MQWIFKMFDGAWASLNAQAGMYYSAYSEEKEIRDWILKLK